MASKDSAKKVAKAARAGRSAGAGQKREVAFPLAIVVVIALGVGLVVYARDSRDATAAPRLNSVDADGNQIGDHWHDAYGIFNCSTDTFEPPITSTNDPLGIHSHQDGLLHIHPFSSQATGDNARLGVFLDAVAMSVTEDAITLPGGQVLAAGTPCGDDQEPAIVQVWRWDLDAEIEAQVFTDDFADIRFRKNREAFTIALAPAGFEPRQPPTTTGVDSATDVLQAPGELSTTTVVTPSELDATTTTTVAPVDETTSTAAVTDE